MDSSSEQISQISKDIEDFVLVVKDIPTTVESYCQRLGMQKITFEEVHTTLLYSSQKINLHQSGQEFEPKAQHMQPDSAGLCFLSDTPVEQIAHTLTQQGVAILERPVPRTGALSPLLSIYLRDPDGNLIEIAN